MVPKTKVRNDGRRITETRSGMTGRQRWLETVTFGPVDRVPFNPGAGRESTRKRWVREGLPPDTQDPAWEAYLQAGGQLDFRQGGPGFWVNERMKPPFEEKVLEQRARTQIVQDWKGNICEISNDYTVEYLRNPIDFVTRKWIKCPVETRADWERMRARYSAEDRTRLPEAAEERAQRLTNRTHVLGMSFTGPFWQLREWVGFEKLCTLFYDDPTWVREMIAFWEDFVYRLLKKAFAYVVPDYLRITEDMAYKGFSMISPAMVHEYLLPTWTRWGALAREHGCNVYAIDSDGYVGELVPLWIEAGINVCEPMEVAAGSDVVAFRQQFGKRMAYLGGIDKRAIAAGGRVLEKEIDRVRPVIAQGGYIPGCDHGVPADVSWKDFVHYVKLLAQATGWM